MLPAEPFSTRTKAANRSDLLCQHAELPGSARAPASHDIEVIAAVLALELLHEKCETLLVSWVSQDSQSEIGIVLGCTRHNT